MLNLAGRTCLAKFVIAFIQTYSMHVFHLLRGVIGRIHQIMRSFIWSSKEGGWGWHLMNWSKLTTSKEQEGLSVRDMELANTTLLVKAVWSFMHKLNKLWVRVLSHMYLTSSSIL